MRKRTLLPEINLYSRKKLSSGRDYVEAVSLAWKGLAGSFLCPFFVEALQKEKPRGNPVVLERFLGREISGPSLKSFEAARAPNRDEKTGRTESLHTL